MLKVHLALYYDCATTTESRQALLFFRKDCTVLPESVIAALTATVEDVRTGQIADKELYRCQFLKGVHTDQIYGHPHTLVRYTTFYRAQRNEVQLIRGVLWQFFDQLKSSGFDTEAFVKSREGTALFAEEFPALVAHIRQEYTGVGGRVGHYLRKHEQFEDRAGIHRMRTVANFVLHKA